MVKEDASFTPVATAKTSSVEETHKLAALLVGIFRPGDVVVLSGDLGAGKTCLLYTSPSPRDPTKSRMPSSA